MFLNILFYFSYFLYAFVVFLSVLLGIIYYLQLDEYKEKSILKSLYYSLKDNYLNILIYLIVLFLIDNPSRFVWAELLLMLNIFVVLMVLMGSKFLYVEKVKYTKRTIRLLVCSGILFLVIQVVFACIFDWWVLVLFFPSTVCLSYLLAYLSLLILKPIEKKINDNYVMLAKEKLKNCAALTKVAVTGSYGKTSTKEILRSILSREFFTLATEKSFNTPMGICLTVNNKLKSTHEVLITEMGAKKRGEIKELCDMVVPDIGIVVSVGRQHMQTFGSVENIYQTKKELPDALVNKKCVFNLDNVYVRKMYDEYKGQKIGVFLMCVKTHSNANVVLKKMSYILKLIKYKSAVYYTRCKKDCVYAKNIIATENGISFDVYYENTYLFQGTSLLLGVHNVTNILLAVAVAYLLGVPTNKMRLGVAEVNVINARLQKIVCSNGSVVLNNGYNANLDASKHTLKVLGLFKRRNKVVITPGLVENNNQYEDNKNFGKMVGKVASMVVIVGALNSKAIFDGLKEIGFNESNVRFVDKFTDANKIIENSDENYVFLIENDLPENYR